MKEKTWGQYQPWSHIIVRRLNLRSSLSTRLTVFSASGQSQNTRRAGCNRRKQLKSLLKTTQTLSYQQTFSFAGVWKRSSFLNLTVFEARRTIESSSWELPTDPRYAQELYLFRDKILESRDMSLSVVQKFTIQFSYVAKTTMWAAKWFCNIWKSGISVDFAYFFLPV